MQNYSALVFIAVVIALFILKAMLSENAKKRRVLKKHPFVSIKEAEEGQLVKIAGTVRFDTEGLCAPFSQRECACWQVEVREYVRTGKGGIWKDPIRDKQCMPFFVEGEGGKVYIDESNIKMVLKNLNAFSFGLLKAPEAHIQNFLKEHDIDTRTALGLKKRIQCEEGVVENGEEVSVFGVVKRKTMEELAGDKGTALVVLAAPDEGELILSYVK